jgi:cytoskeletal protein CcmA (bactofilin family)
MDFQPGSGSVCAIRSAKVEGEMLMFRKPEPDFQSPELPASIPAVKSNPVEHRRESATIGPSIAIKGDLIGEEDLVIQGRVEGKVDLKQNSVTIGKDGRVKADIYAKLVTVEGEVEGNLYGLEQIILRATGCVRGNISAPRVSIEDGARFKGGIDMDAKLGDRNRAPIAVEGKTNALPIQQAPKPGIPIKTEVPSARIG